MKLGYLSKGKKVMKNVFARMLVGCTVSVLLITGCGKTNNQDSVSSPAPLAAPTPVRTYKADNMILMFKNSSNPFEIREKVVGKRIETQMFVEKFIDEGANAKMIDANTGFFCRMPGSEYGQHNKRGVIVVVGTFVQEAGDIGLNDCHFVSNDLDWKATDSYEELIK
jgi:hypothetical protein